MRAEKAGARTNADNYEDEHGQEVFQQLMSPRTSWNSPR